MNLESPVVGRFQVMFDPATQHYHCHPEWHSSYPSSTYVCVLVPQNGSSSSKYPWPFSSSTCTSWIVLCVLICTLREEIWGLGSSFWTKRQKLYVPGQWVGVSLGSRVQGLFSPRWRDHKGHMPAPPQSRQHAWEGVMDQSATPTPSQRSGDSAHESPKTLPFLPCLETICTVLFCS